MKDKERQDVAGPGDRQGSARTGRGSATSARSASRPSTSSRPRPTSSRRSSRTGSSAICCKSAASTSSGSRIRDYAVDVMNEGAHPARRYDHRLQRRGRAQVEAGRGPEVRARKRQTRPEVSGRRSSWPPTKSQRDQAGRAEDRPGRFEDRRRQPQAGRLERRPEGGGPVSPTRRRPDFSLADKGFFAAQLEENGPWSCFPTRARSASR